MDQNYDESQPDTVTLKQDEVLKTSRIPVPGGVNMHFNHSGDVANYFKNSCLHDCISPTLFDKFN